MSGRSESTLALFEQFRTLGDNDLIRLAQKGTQEAVSFLLNKYKSLVKMKANSYFLVGADKEDLIQEGMIGLYKAILDFRENKEASFRVFAELCITRQIITAIKTATRQKHLPLNTYVSLARPTFNEGETERPLSELLHPGYTIDPVELLISNEEIDNIKYCFNELLSSLEATVLSLYMEGNSYQDIARILDRHVKSIDNALQRVKRKLDLHLKKSNELA